MRKIFTVSRVLLTAALYGLVIQSQAAPDKGELEVLVNGVVGPTWVQGITGVSDDIPWTSCVGDGGLNCNNIKWQFVNDTERGQVLEVSHKEVSATGYAFLEIAKTKDINYSGVDLSAFSGGHLNLDIKVIDSGENSSGFSAYINCFYPCQGSKTIGPVGLQGWETVRIPIDQLVQAGLNLSDVNLGLGLHPNFGEMDGVTYQIDNVYWSKKRGKLSSLDDNRKSFSYSVDGQTVTLKNGHSRIYSYQNLLASQNGDGPLMTGQRYDEGYVTLGLCRFNYESGTALKLVGFEYFDTTTFPDGSKLQAQLIEHTVCEVENNDGSNMGSYRLIWEITGGTGRFENARGQMIGEGVYRVLVNSRNFGSADYKGTRKIELN